MVVIRQPAVLLFVVAVGLILAVLVGAAAVFLLDAVIQPVLGRASEQAQQLYIKGRTCLESFGRMAVYAAALCFGGFLLFMIWESPASIFGAGRIDSVSVRDAEED